MRPGLNVSRLIFFQMPQLGKTGPQSHPKLHGSLRTQARPFGSCSRSIHTWAAVLLCSSITGKGESNRISISFSPGFNTGFTSNSQVRNILSALANLLAVDLDGGQSIQSFALQENAVVFQDFLRHIESALVDPIAFANPLDGVFVVAIKRIGDFSRRQQIRMDTTGNGCRGSNLLCRFPKPARRRSNSSGVGLQMFPLCKWKPTVPRRKSPRRP